MLVVCVPRVMIHGDSWRHLCLIVGGVRVYVGVCACVDSKRLRVCRQNARVLYVLPADTEAF